MGSTPIGSTFVAQDKFGVSFYMNTKICSRCNDDLALERFSKNKSSKDGRHHQCKECRSASNKESYLRYRHSKLYKETSENRKQSIRDWFANYKKSLSCELCGENHPACLQFHHKDRNDKTIEVSQAVLRKWSIESIEKEIKKCQVLCANCHFKLHYEEPT